MQNGNEGDKQDKRFTIALFMLQVDHKRNIIVEMLFNSKIIAEVDKFFSHIGITLSESHCHS